MKDLKLPNFEEIRSYVVSDPNFLKRLTEAGRKTLKTKRETSLEYQLDLTNLNKYLSNVFLGKKKEAAYVKNPFGLSKLDYITLLTLHSHPGQDIIRPSGGDMLTDFAKASSNIQAIQNHLDGTSRYPHMGEVFRLSKLYNWTHTNAIIAPRDDGRLGLLLYQPPFLSEPRRVSERIDVKSQEGILGGLRDQGCTTEFLKYKMGQKGIYQPE